MSAPRVVRVKRGQTVALYAGRGAVLELERFASGAVHLRDGNSGRIMRAWSPKEAKHA